MKRIGITQRVELEPQTGERRDCLDQAWTILFKTLGFDLIPIPNRSESISLWADRIGLDGIVLSGGNDLAHLPNAKNPALERDVCEMALMNWAANSEVPVLGVCRGMQIMNCFLGGSLIRVSGHITAKHSVDACTESNLFLKYSTVNSFHDWGIDANGLSTSLTPLLMAEDGSVEAFQHVSMPWLGIMWHPERHSCHNFDLDSNLLRVHFSSAIKR